MKPEPPATTAPSQPSQADRQAQREAHWRRVWASRAWPAWGWWPLSQVYGGLLALRRLGYARGWFKSTRVPCPVLVVGNVIAGGAGKTPTTIALVQHLQAAGLQVGVVSRGHGGQPDEGMRHDPPQPRQAWQAVTAQALASQVGDEPLLIHLRTGAPVFVARQRALAAQALLAAHPSTQVIVCDDGLQHLALARDLQLCVFDERGAGNGWLLPAGPLREPWPKRGRALDWTLQIQDADMRAVALPVSGAHVGQRQLADHAVDAQGHRVPLQDLIALNSQLVAFAGIAKPEQFFAGLRQRGLQPAREIALGDHASAMDDAWLQALLQRGVPHQALDDSLLVDLLDHGVPDAHATRLSGSHAPAGPIVLCTEKDAVKLWPHFPQVLAVPLQLSLPPDLLADVLARVHQLQDHASRQTHED